MKTLSKRKLIADLLWLEQLPILIWSRTFPLSGMKFLQLPTLSQVETYRTIFSNFYDSWPWHSDRRCFIPSRGDTSINLPLETPLQQAQTQASNLTIKIPLQNRERVQYLGFPLTVAEVIRFDWIAIAFISLLVPGPKDLPPSRSALYLEQRTTTDGEMSVHVPS